MEWKKLENAIQQLFSDDLRRIEIDEKHNRMLIYFKEDFRERHLRIVGLIEKEITSGKIEFVINADTYFDYEDEYENLVSVKMVLIGKD